MQRRVLLVILDGWGLAPAGPANAESLAKTPNFDFLWSHYPHLKLHASGEEVGLPKGQIGNSEVGHLNIGAGRVVWQDLPRISNAIKDGSFFKNEVLLKTFEYAKKNNKPVHMLGLLSDGGVHSHISHLFALMKMAKESGVTEVYIHAFTDGRDEEPQSAERYIRMLNEQIKQIGIGKIATISGRYYAMDRDSRRGRIEAVYNAMVLGEGDLGDSAEQVISDSYKRGVTDEFIPPTILDSKGLISDGDAVIFFNFRSDRPRELTRALTDTAADSFKRAKILKNLYFVTLTEYDPTLKIKGVAFPYIKINNVLSEVISADELTQFHIAETEKYAHVTYFLDGGEEKPFSGEENMLIPSPKISTYDKKPEMSAEEVTKNLLERIGKYDFIVVNYANADMVGHTGMMKPAIKACEVVDSCLGEVVKKAREKDYNVIVTADHGNIEKMINTDGSPCTAHTTNPVPFILISNGEYKLRELNSAKLANIAPTILKLMGVPKPQEMEADCLI
jgi:2,3-bisphosphoglycerate-independent phosphoglycerate mutase